MWLEHKQKWFNYWFLMETITIEPTAAKFNADENEHTMSMRSERSTDNKRQAKRETKAIKQKWNVWLLIDARAFTVMSDEVRMETFPKCALINSCPLCVFWHFFSPPMTWTHHLSVLTPGTGNCENNRMWNNKARAVCMNLEKKESQYFNTSATSNITNIDFCPNYNLFPCLFRSFRHDFKGEHLMLLRMLVCVCMCMEYQ